MFWNNDTDVSLLGYFRVILMFLFPLYNSPYFCFTGFYGNPKVELRRFSWDLLWRLHYLFNLPWLVVGDLDEILLPDKKTSREENN